MDDVRRISLALPGAEEVLATPAVQSDLIDLDPETYSVASHVGRYGWVAVALERIDPELVRPLLVEAWRMTAPRRLQTGS